MEFFTIGVYNSTESEFFDKLIKNNIDTFCDIRQRRGVRGAKYSFVNSNRLQEQLHELEIRYAHILELAPTEEIRNLQKERDSTLGERKTERKKLGDVFTIEYKNKILNRFSLDFFLERLDDANAKKVVLFCVEELPEACHRSIVANKLASLNFSITHL